MRIGNNVSGAECFYTKITPALVNRLRAKKLIGLGDKPKHKHLSDVRIFKVKLPTYRSKPGNKKEKVKLSFDPNLTAYCFNVQYDSPLKNGELVEWEISIW